MPDVPVTVAKANSVLDRDEDGFPILPGNPNVPLILTRIANGSTVKAACEGTGISHIRLGWLRIEHPEIEDAYKAAVEVRGENLVDEILTLADQPIEVPPDTADEHKAPMYRALLAKRDLEVQTRKWAAARMYARMYGEKAAAVQINNTQVVNGAIGDVIRESVDRRKGKQPKIVDVTPEPVEDGDK